MRTYKSPFTDHKIRLTKHITGSVCRTLLALTFLFSGFVKAVDPLGTVYKIQDYLQEGFGGVLQWALPLAGTLAVLLITTELLLGVTMLFNVRSRWTSWATLAFYLLMTPVTLYIAISNPVSDCGCFGDALVISNWATFAKNVVLLALAIVFVICRKAIPQLFSWWAELCIALLALGFAAGIMGYSYTHLPIIDFRPYKVGNNIKELMENGTAPIYDVYYTCEKDGEQKEFLYQDRPDVNGDTSWTVISSRTVTVRPAKEPTITDFRLELLMEDADMGIDANGEEVSERYIYEEEDLTEDILSSEEPVTLIVMYDVKKRDRGQAVRAVQLLKDIRSRGEQAYILTGSDEKDLFDFAEEMELDINSGAYLFMDKTPIKTIIRANPGVVVLQNGVVVSKHNMRQL